MYLTSVFSFLYSLNILFVRSSVTSRKLYLVEPKSIVILKPMSLNTFIVFSFLFSTYCLFFGWIMASPLSLYNPIILGSYIDSSLLNAYSPIKSHNSAPKKEPMGTSNRLLFSFLIQVFLLKVKIVLHVCLISLMSQSSVVMFFFCKVYSVYQMLFRYTGVEVNDIETYKIFFCFVLDII